MLAFAERLSSGRSELLPDPYTIKIASQFSETPIGRYRTDGPESGEVFREDILIPALAKHQKVRLVFDGVEGLPSSFWEEVMGGLIRRGLPIDQLREKLDLETSDAALAVYVRLGWRYAQAAANGRKH